MDRRQFLISSATGAAALAAASVPVSCSSGTSKKSGAVPLRISFQEGIAPREELNAKLDYMESLGVVGFEPGGRGLAQRVNEIEQALRGRNISVSAICAGFDGFILSSDPAVKAEFDASFKDILAAAGQLGSTGVIMVPAFNGQEPCLPHTQATRDYLCEQLHELGEYALKCGTSVILEPLNRRECFFMRLVSDAAAICRDSQSEGIRCMGDFWHMQEETSDYAAFISAGDCLRHVHIAGRGDRKMPGETPDVDNYVDGFRALKEMNYKYFVSFECGSEGDREQTVPAAVELMRNQWERA